jgi:two-component system phosphate regulon response regulator PhoB
MTADIINALPTVLSGPAVLVVEDDAPLRELYRSLLRDAGYSVTAVEDGLAALHSVEKRVPAAVVLDLALPRLSGRDVFQELKARPETRRIPIVVVTGHDVSDLVPSDFASILRKPLSPDSLVAAVQSCVRRGGRPDFASAF